MRELTIEEMAEIQGGLSAEEILCNVGVTQLGMWNSIAFGLAFSNPAGIIAVSVGAAAFTIGGMFLCDAITS